MPKQKVRYVHVCALHPWLVLAIPFSDFGYNSREISRKTRETAHTRTRKDRKNK